MTSNIFPDIDEPVTAKAAAIREAEKLLIGYTAYNLPLLNHVDNLPPHYFLDDGLGTAYSRLLAERAAGCVETDPALVAPELLEIASQSDLERFEKQAPNIKPARIKSLVGKVKEGWAGRELRRSTNVLGFGDEPVVEQVDAMQRRMDHIKAALPGQAAGKDHPLAQFRKLSQRPPAVKWVVPGVIEEGVVSIAGARGVGKTTALLPLALSAAGLHEPGYPLAPHPDRWRHIIYAVEQFEQAERIMAGVIDCSGMGITREQVEERLHLVEAKRLTVETVVQVAGFYSEQFVRVVNGVKIKPLVVFDTVAASFDVESENDNTEASRIMAALKQQFDGIPIWIVGHVAKTLIDRNEVESMSMRGGGAYEGDAIQNCYLIKDKEQRFLAIGKHRAEPRFGKELMIEAYDQIITGYNEWNEPEDVHLRWAIVRPADQSRAELRQQAQEAAERDRRGDMRQAIFDAVQVAWQAGNPTNKTGVKSSISGFKKDDIGQEVETLLAEGWLHEVEVPSKQRINSKKSRFLVKLDTPEHDDFMRSGIVPAAKLVIPQSWRKAEIPSDPEVEVENAEKPHPEQ